MTVAGTWNLKMATPMGEQAVTLVLIENGQAVGGTATSGDETVSLDAISVDGQRLSWAQKVTKPFPMMVAFDLTFDGDTTAGTAKPGMLPPSKVTGVRV